MNQNSPIKPGGSLIERASEIYNFGRIQLPVSGPDMAAAPSPAPAPIPAPVVAPAPVPSVAAPVIAPAPVEEPLPAVEAYRAPETKHVTSPRPTATVDPVLLQQSGFILPGLPPTALSEEFRMVKRQLLLSALGGRKTPAVERGRAILVCSAQPNEGKTFCAVNLALSMASEADVEVLLVDADVAKPEVLSTLGIEGGAGLMDALSDSTIDIEDLIIPTSIPKLSVLPAGRQANNDTEVLASSRTQTVVDRLISSNPARIIIIDTAPALAASPASVLAHQVGQVLMVVRADQTKENELREALILLDGCSNMKLILNGASYAGTNQKFGSYYGYGG